MTQEPGVEATTDFDFQNLTTGHSAQPEMTTKYDFGDLTTGKSESPIDEMTTEL